ncbi:MAG: class I SAM-dependent methyltransferase [Gemmatimonadaceae bacterium]
MNWKNWRAIPWIDTRADFVAPTPQNGTLLDLGSSDGGTLCHMAELRPDLRFFSVDLAGPPAQMPQRTTFVRADLESDSLPWPDASFDSITCMHVVEHLRTMTNLWREAARLLKPGGRIYVETPGPESLTTPSPPPKLRGQITMNFYDDPTHIGVVSIDSLAKQATNAGLLAREHGRSRNWLFVGAYPFLSLLPLTRKRLVAKLHWLGWSAYVIAEKPVR